MVLSHVEPCPKKAPSKAFKAKCATNIIEQVVQRRAALATSQGHRKPPIIMCGDLNVTRAVLMYKLGVVDVQDDIDMMAQNEGNLYCISDCNNKKLAGIPHIKGPDNMHHAGFFEVFLNDTCQFGAGDNLPQNWAKVSNTTAPHKAGVAHRNATR